MIKFSSSVITTVRFYQHYIQGLVQLNYTSFQLRCERSRSYKRAHAARNGAHTARAHVRVKNAQSIGLALALTSLVASAREQGGANIENVHKLGLFFLLGCSVGGPSLSLCGFGLRCC